MSKNQQGPSTTALIWLTIGLMLLILCGMLIQGYKGKASVSLCLSCPEYPGTVAGVEVGAWGHLHSLDVHTARATGSPGVNVGVWREGWAPESGRWIFLEIQ